MSENPVMITWPSWCKDLNEKVRVIFIFVTILSNIMLIFGDQSTTCLRLWASMEWSQTNVIQVDDDDDDGDMMMMMMVI